MKSLIVASTLLVSISGYCTDVVCKLDREIAEITEFNMTNIEGDIASLVSDLPDQSTLSEFFEDEGVMRASFSNECDNLYEVVLDSLSYAAVVAGTSDVVGGALAYEYADGTKEFANLKCTAKR